MSYFNHGFLMKVSGRCFVCGIFVFVLILSMSTIVVSEDARQVTYEEVLRNEYDFLMETINRVMKKKFPTSEDKDRYVGELLQNVITVLGVKQKKLEEDVQSRYQQYDRAKYESTVFDLQVLNGLHASITEKEERLKFIAQYIKKYDAAREAILEKKSDTDAVVSAMPVVDDAMVAQKKKKCTNTLTTLLARRKNYLNTGASPIEIAAVSNEIDVLVEELIDLGHLQGSSIDEIQKEIESLLANIQSAADIESSRRYFYSQKYTYRKRERELTRSYHPKGDDYRESEVYFVLQDDAIKENKDAVGTAREHRMAGKSYGVDVRNE